ncbi:hypothetical protein FYK55_02775 [Roseiconus nitratireducens]|uniref:Uncharacterized protein n=1 Tax=Roseiconus nitratireducens TaxID=2605748 RepID=A0A5M6DE85_9BACT|nr:DUF4175 family protein [Roseiconus nitratireducens]KAA5545861.1 hypothetical protein FYK55_02775 [Roseiconus nitratireducens]
MIEPKMNPDQLRFDSQVGVADRQLDRVLYEIEQVSSRIRAKHFWTLLAVLASVSALFGIMLRGAATSGQIDRIWVVIWVAAGLFLSGLVAAILSRRLAGRSGDTATTIERQYPGLGQRLLTTAGLSRQQTGSSLTQRLIRETHEHFRSHDWRRVVSTGALWISRSLGIAACLAAIGVALLGFSGRETGPASLIGPSPMRVERQVLVQPGNVLLERGSSLVVTAEFSRDVPETAKLLTITADGGESELQMKRNLGDPILGGFVSSVDQAMQYQIVSNDWSSERFSVEVFEFPELLRSDAELRFPEYTGMNPRTVEDTVKVTVVEGTELQWRLILNKSVTRCDLVRVDQPETVISCDPDEPIDFSRQDAVCYRAEMPTDVSASYTLMLEDADGRQNKFPPQLTVKVLPNQPPSLKLDPARDVTVSPLEELEVGAAVQDDFGVLRSGVSYTLEMNPGIEVELISSVERNQKKQVQHTIDFEELQAEPDDVLSFYFWAEDVGPDGQVRRTESDLFFADVRPFEQIFRAGQSQPPPGGQPSGQAQQAEELAGTQKQIITAIWNQIRKEQRGESIDEKDLTTIAESQQAGLDQLGELASELQDAGSIEIAKGIAGTMQQTIDELADADLDPALKSAKASFSGLMKLRSREFEVTRSRQSQQSSSGGGNQNRQQQLDELELDEDESRYETQQQAAQQSAQQQAAAEDRQVLSRLRELAQRTEDLNEELAKLQTALQQAKTEEEKEEVQRQLKRLREQQQELLRESDELESRMRSPENSERMSEQADQLQQSREDLRQAAQATENEDPSSALAAGRRAESQFDELQQEFRRRAAGAFDETVRQMQQEAQRLQDQQEEIGRAMREETEQASPGLRGDESKASSPDQLQQQAERVEQLLNQMEETVREAEESEPLLAERLYDAFRETRQADVEQQLRNAAELVRRGFTPQADPFEQQAAEGIRNLREKIDSAADAVLGDSEEGLRRAAAQLEQLAEGVEREINQETGRDSGPGQQRETDDQQSGSQQQGSQQQDSQQQGSQQQGSQQQGSQQQGSQQQGSQQQGSQQQGSQQQGSQQQGSQQQGSQQQGSQRQGSQQQGSQQQGSQQQGSQQQGSQQQGSQQQGSQQQGSQQQGGEGQPSSQADRPSPGLRGGGGQSGDERREESTQPNNRAADSPSTGGPIGPMTGDFRSWSDRMRDVEEMVNDPDLRARAGAIRDRVRQMRVEMKRHGDSPQWNLVEDLVAEPLRELQADVKAELLRRTANKNALVPIDRDPVPEQFSDAVQRYYENLGSVGSGESEGRNSP